MLVGTLVTVVAALVPARRATKVLPVEALREATPGSRPPSKKRLVIGTLTLVGGVAAVLNALYGDGSPKLLGLGVPAALIGVITLAPVAARPLAAGIGWPLRLRGVPGELARQNAMRNPRRTASTATALMIGLTLVVSMGVFAGFAEGVVRRRHRRLDQGGPVRHRRPAPGAGVQPRRSPRWWRRSPGVQAVSAIGWGEARFDGPGRRSYSSVDPATAEDV